MISPACRHHGLGRIALLFILALLSGTPGDAMAQESDDAPSRWTVAAGVGNSMGWSGIQAEYHALGYRGSVFGGFGYTPQLDPGDPGGPTFAIGMRGFVGHRHRGLLELSFSQLLVTNLQAPEMGLVERDRYAGPGLQIGYQALFDSGFTVLFTGGAGYAPGVDESTKARPVQPMFSAGIGYTWR